MVRLYNVFPGRIRRDAPCASPAPYASPAPCASPAPYTSPASNAFPVLFASASAEASFTNTAPSAPAPVLSVTHTEPVRSG
ncbi:hypothetical protein E0486_16590 [Flaviaesturariibacter aridisoli]|uniref:Uncharacterized protein n=1 Tax=Flaviaesturariibacter aridisoli TaxID=2545761 RepID=A0A4R4DVH5_9BACT|nr:hypothetical protein E0486_16590 [Flaviaesturariibacter aridisoli]